VTAIERTAYPRFKKNLSTRELQTIYTPTPEEMAFVRHRNYDPQAQLNLMVSLKCFQRLGYFPAADDIPQAIIDHLRLTLQLPPDLQYGYQVRRTRYRHHTLIQNYLQVTDYASGGEAVVTATVMAMAPQMGDPADLINVAIEELIRQRFELPAFSTLNHLVQRLRVEINEQIYAMVSDRLSPTVQDRLDQLLLLSDSDMRTPFTQLKQAPAKATLSHMKEWAAHLQWLESILTVTLFLKGVALSRVQQFAAEAYALEPFALREMTASRRYTLLLCLLDQMQRQARDSLVEMFLKRMNRIHHKGKEALDLMREQQRETAERLVEMLGEIVFQAGQELSHADLGEHIRTLLDQHGGVEAVGDACEAVSAYHNNNYLPFLWQFYRSHRQNLFRLIDLLDIQSTTQDTALLTAIEFIKDHRRLHRTYLPDTLPLDFASTRWRALIYERREGQRVLNRRHLEVCVFSYLAWELQNGDMAVAGSESFADYREQLLPWDECEPLVADYCHHIGLPDTPKAFVDQLQTWLTDAAHTCDQNFPDNAQLEFDKSGEPVLKRLKRQAKPVGSQELRRALVDAMPQRGILEILHNVQHWIDYLVHFGPLSGTAPKLSEATFRYLLTTFAYGCNLGPKQTADHTQGVTERMLSFVNRQHITSDKLDAALRDIINRYLHFTLARCWGVGERAIADGTLIDLYDNNLLAEYHIRYGGYGGIAYHHIADNYIALFSHFIACGVWEAVYIIDGLLKNKSELQPDILHADTQGQNAPVFGLAHLLGIKLMPRIRNWKDLTLFRSDREVYYEHIDLLFGDPVNWTLLETHWQDLMQVVISIQQGKVLPSMLLRKLGYRSRKNRLYRAFRELGRVVRTVFLLQYISDPALRRQITAETNKVETYNGFLDWLRFGNQGVMRQREPIEQEKSVKYNDLVANTIILQNVADMTRLLPRLAEQGHIVTRETLATLSPYLTRHIRRFGDYFLDVDQTPEPLQFELPFEI
jgi:TnpA family transposase